MKTNKKHWLIIILLAVFSVAIILYLTLDKPADESVVVQPSPPVSEEKNPDQRSPDEKPIETDTTKPPLDTEEKNPDEIKKSPKEHTTPIYNDIKQYQNLYKLQGQKEKVCSDPTEVGTCHGRTIEGFTNKPGYIEKIKIKKITNQDGTEGWKLEKQIDSLTLSEFEKLTPPQIWDLYGFGVDEVHEDGAWVTSIGNGLLGEKMCNLLDGEFDGCSDSCDCRDRHGKTSEGVCFRIVITRCLSKNYFY